MNIETKNIVVKFINGTPNDELMKEVGRESLAGLYHVIRGYLFCVAKEFPDEMIELVKKSTGNFNKRIMENKTERVKKQIVVVENILEGKSLVQISKLLGCSYPKAQALLKEFILPIAPDFSLTGYKSFLLIHEDEIITRLEKVKSKQS